MKQSVQCSGLIGDEISYLFLFSPLQFSRMLQ